MGLSNGGWDVITTAHPPTEIAIEKNVALIIDYFTDNDHESFALSTNGRRDSIAVKVYHVSRTHRHTIVEGYVVAGQVDDLKGHRIRAIIHTNHRHGYLELMP